MVYFLMYDRCSCYIHKKTLQIPDMNVIIQNIKYYNFQVSYGWVKENKNKNFFINYYAQRINYLLLCTPQIYVISKANAGGSNF